MPVRTKNVYDAPEPEDGKRVLVMRLYPRGVKRDKFHEWRKELGTSPDLIKAWKSHNVSWEEFARRYQAQIQADAEAQASLKQLSQRVQGETITLLCSCADEEHCHRTLLKSMIEIQLVKGE